MLIAHVGDPARGACGARRQRLLHASVGIVSIICLTGGGADAADRPTAVPGSELQARRWDLDGDGRIDESEAELARSKMRLERAELQAKLLAGDGAETAGKEEPPAAEPKRSRLFESEEQDDQPRRPAVEPRPKRQDLNAAARPGTGSAALAEGDPEQAAGARRRPVRADADGGPTVVTGGARAGGLARPGYGSAVPRGDLNAGRPILPRGVGQRPVRSGGLLPGSRRGSGPPPAPEPRPRVTAEDVPY